MNNDMNDMQTNIERMVMRRVHLIRILKLIISTVALAVLMFVAALWGIGREVWVARVFENAPQNIADLPGFYVAAFAHTNIVVQALTILTLVSLLFLTREIARLFLNLFAPPRA